MIPFDIPSIGAWQSDIDLSWLNEKPAGKHGFIRVADGHFVDGVGKRIRFMGGGLIRAACFPDHAHAELLAPRVAMQGMNLLRVHHIDTSYAPNGFWDPAYKDKHHLDAGQLGRFDYLVHQLKQHGVYVNINLHVSRTFTEADGIPEAALLPTMGKGVSEFIPRMIELQKKYAADLLTHRNPYTGNRYVDEPAIAAVEINNECSLAGTVMSGKLHRLPDRYEQLLTARWNAWLRKRYASTPALEAAWGAASHPMGEEILTNGSFADGAEAWVVEKPGVMETRTVPDGPDGRPALHIRCVKPGELAWTMQMHQIHLDYADGKPYTFEFWIRSSEPAQVAVVARLDHAHPDTGRFDVVGLNRTFRCGTEWERRSYTFVARNPRPRGNRIGFTFPNAVGEFWLAGLSLRPGGRMGGPGPGETLEAGTVRRPVSRGGLLQEWRDWLECVCELEADYFREMRRYLKENLGVRCPVIGSQASYGGLFGMLRESDMDYTDMHAYWQHPRFPGTAWDMKNWRIAPKSMVRGPGSILLRLASYRIAGKPFVVSEFNHPNPNPHAAECWPMMASFAAWQDWDGLVVHNYVNYDWKTWRERRYNHFFDTATSPQKAPFLPAAAVMFRLGAVPAAAARTLLEVPRDTVVGRMAQGQGSAEDAWGDGVDRTAAAVGSQLAVSLTDGDGAPRVTDSGMVGGPITWRREPGQPAVYEVNTDMALVLAGEIVGRSHTVGALTVQLDRSTTGSAVVTLVSLDGKPIPASGKRLLSIVGDAQNTGWKRSHNGESLSYFGGNPTLAEVVPGRVTLACDAPAAVWALDGGGRRRRKTEAQFENGQLILNIPPDASTVWYEIRKR